MQTNVAAHSDASSIVYCIGDSHVCFFSGEDTIQPCWPQQAHDVLPWFKTFRIGSSLAYNLSKCGAQTRGREHVFEVLDTRVPLGARVLLSFGEIDCRVHLVRQSRVKGLPLEVVVERCLDEYFKVVEEIAGLGFQVVVYNVVPSRVRTLGVVSDGEQDYVTTGTWRERNHAARLFNKGARRRGAACGALFLENFEQLVDARGKTIQWYFWDSIHLSQRGMPATLEKLRVICPGLGIPPQRVERLGSWSVAVDVLRRRCRRVTKEIRKIPRIFGSA